MVDRAGQEGFNFTEQLKAEREKIIHEAITDLQKTNPQIFEEGIDANNWDTIYALVSESVITKNQLIPQEADVVVKEALGQVSGWGPLMEFIVGRPDAPEITEVQIVPQGKKPPNIFYCKHGRPHYAGNHYFKDSYDAVLKFCRKIVEASGRELIKDAPIVDAWMKDMSRLAVAAYNVCPQGISASIRKTPLAREPIPLEAMVKNGTIPQIYYDMEKDLLIPGGASVSVNGRTDSGKTTFYTGRMGLVNPQERVIIGETSFEMFLPNLPNCFNMVEVVVGGKKILTMKDICESVLRNNPDWFVASEIRGAEIVSAAIVAESLSGKFGATFHASDVISFENKIFGLYQQQGITLTNVHRKTQSMFNFLVFLDKDAYGRRILMELVEITDDGYETILKLDEDEYAATQGTVRRWIYNKPISQKRLSRLAFRGAKNVELYTQVKEKHHYAQEVQH